MDARRRPHLLDTGRAVAPIRQIEGAAVALEAVGRAKHPQDDDPP